MNCGPTYYSEALKLQFLHYHILVISFEIKFMSEWLILILLQLSILSTRCPLTTIADSNPANVIFGKSLSILASFLSSHYSVHLIFVLAYFMESLIYSFKCLLFHWLQLLLSKCKQILKNGFSGCKNRICHHKFKLDARHNDWTKKEAKIFRTNSVISPILHWLDWNRQLWPRDI